MKFPRAVDSCWTIDPQYLKAIKKKITSDSIDWEEIEEVLLVVETIEEEKANETVR